MRIDLLLSRLGLIKRRTVAKEMTDNGLVKINGRNAKPSQEVRPGDIIGIGGKWALTVEITEIPGGSVKKDDRLKYYKLLS